MSQTCSTCGASIIWAQTEAGKPIPLDAEPVPDGNIMLSMGTAYVRKTKGGSGNGDVWASHFATCPDADQHRKPKHTQETML